MEIFYLINKTNYIQLTKEEYYIILDSLMENKDKLIKTNEYNKSWGMYRHSHTIEIETKNFFDKNTTSLKLRHIIEERK